MTTMSQGLQMDPTEALPPVSAGADARWMRLALAEALAAPLVTRDAKLASATGHRARIELM